MTGKPHDPAPNASVDFEAAACKRTAQPAKKKTPSPFSLRLSPEERARLEAAAAGEPLGAFIRRKVLEEDSSLRARRRSAPVKDHAALAQTLGMLGHMRIANNLNQLARAANIGALPLTREVEEDLFRACAAVLAMKAELMRALGYPAEGDE